MNLTKTLLATCLLAATTLPLTAMAVEEEATPEQAAATTGGNPLYAVGFGAALAYKVGSTYVKNNPYRTVEHISTASFVYDAAVSAGNFVKNNFSPATYSPQAQYPNLTGAGSTLR